jgi:hypothetical protein
MVSPSPKQAMSTRPELYHTGAEEHEFIHADLASQRS